MTKGSDNQNPKIILTTGVLRAAPSGGLWEVQALADGIYARSSNAAVGPFAAAASALSAASNATDVGNLSVVGATGKYSDGAHVHRGLHSLSHSSNTVYGDITLVPQGTVGITFVAPGTFNINAGAGSGSGSSALSYLSNQLAADVNIAAANTYYTGPSVTLSTGTWLLTGVITMRATGGACGKFFAKLWDGTTVASSAQSCSDEATGNGTDAIPLVGIAVVTSGTPTWKISGAGDGGGATVNMLAAMTANAAGNTASTLVAVKIA